MNLEMAMAPHSSTLVWKIPWTEEPGRLQSMGSLRVWHDWATSLSLFTFMHWRRKCNPLQCSCLENPRDGRAWWATVYGVAQSQTRLKRLNSNSNSSNWWIRRTRTMSIPQPLPTPCSSQQDSHCKASWNRHMLSSNRAFYPFSPFHIVGCWNKLTKTIQS